MVVLWLTVGRLHHAVFSDSVVIGGIEMHIGWTDVDMRRSIVCCCGGYLV